MIEAVLIGVALWAVSLLFASFGPGELFGSVDLESAAALDALCNLFAAGVWGAFSYWVAFLSPPMGGAGPTAPRP